MLILFTPGAPREDYFETLRDAAKRDAMDAEAWANGARPVVGERFDVVGAP